MTTTRISFVSAWLALFMSTIATAESDFSGSWVLNTSKGENLGMVAAIQETLTIEQTAEELRVKHAAVFQGNESLREVNYNLKGAPVTNYAAMGDKSETVSEWRGAELVTTWTSEGAIAGTTVTRTETRALAEDGKIMTVATARADRPAMILVYERRE